MDLHQPHQSNFLFKVWLTPKSVVEKKKEHPSYFTSLSGAGAESPLLMLLPVWGLLLLGKWLGLWGRRGLAVTEMEFRIYRF